MATIVAHFDDFWVEAGGRPLRLEEVTYITEVIRRLKALLLMAEDLDANYHAVANKTSAFQSNSEK